MNECNIYFMMVQNNFFSHKFLSFFFPVVVVLFLNSFFQSHSFLLVFENDKSEGCEHGKKKDKAGEGALVAS